MGYPEPLGHPIATQDIQRDIQDFMACHEDGKVDGQRSPWIRDNTSTPTRQRDGKTRDQKDSEIEKSQASPGESHPAPDAVKPARLFLGRGLGFHFGKSAFRPGVHPGADARLR